MKASSQSVGRRMYGVWIHTAAKKEQTPLPMARVATPNHQNVIALSMQKYDCEAPTTSGIARKVLANSPHVASETSHMVPGKG